MSVVVVLRIASGPLLAHCCAKEKQNTKDRFQFVSVCVCVWDSLCVCVCCVLCCGFVFKANWLRAKKFPHFILVYLPCVCVFSCMCGCVCVWWWVCVCGNALKFNETLPALTALCVRTETDEQAARVQLTSVYTWDEFKLILINQEERTRTGRRVRRLYW